MSQPSGHHGGKGLATGTAGLSGSPGGPQFTMVPRFLVLSGAIATMETTARGRSGGGPWDGAETHRIMLEYDETSGLFAPVWLSIRPHEARHSWRLQVTPQFEHVVGLLVHRGVPIVWLTARWDWVGRNLMTPASPSYLVDFLKPVEICPA